MSKSRFSVFYYTRDHLKYFVSYGDNYWEMLEDYDVWKYSSTSGKFYFCDNSTSYVYFLDTQVSNFDEFRFSLSNVKIPSLQFLIDFFDLEFYEPCNYYINSVHSVKFYIYN